MKRNLYSLLIFCLFSCAAVAQDTDEEEDFQTEFMYGINFNTNGGLIGGLVFRYSTAIDPNTNQTFGLEIVNVKHPQEIKTQSATNGNNYVLGKSNYLFSIRPQYGRERILFRKAPEEGVRITAIGAVGPSIGIIKPYYIAIQTGAGDTRIEQYDPFIHNNSNDIIGAAGFARFKGTQIGVGLHAKLGLGFEIGGFRSSATGFEVGALVEAFAKKVVIVPLAENRSVFTSVYLNVFFKSKK